jgi:hypothetical protein
LTLLLKKTRHNAVLWSRLIFAMTLCLLPP